MKSHIAFLSLMLIMPLFVLAVSPMGKEKMAIKSDAANYDISDIEKPPVCPAVFPLPSRNAPITDKAQYSLGDLFVLDRLFTKGGNGPLDRKRTSLGDIFLLNALFNRQEIGSAGNAYSLGDLFVLDKLFAGADTPSSDKGQTSLGDLLILDRLFNK